jgi:hypothetical protein
MADFRVAFSFENELRDPAPKESSPGIWVYEIEATGREAALSAAEQRWRDELHIQVGDSPPHQTVVTSL